MDEAEARAIREALRGAGRLKDTLRSGFTQAGAQESVAEHSWRLCLMTLLLAPRLGVDPLRALGLAVVHDLGEALSGDTPAPLQAADPGKSARERADLAALIAPAPAAMRAQVMALWEEYEAAATPEARLVKALDKLETVMTHAEGANPSGFDYSFNLGYGRKATDAVPRPRRLARAARRRDRRAGWRRRRGRVRVRPASKGRGTAWISASGAARPSSARPARASATAAPRRWRRTG